MGNSQAVIHDNDLQINNENTEAESMPPIENQTKLVEKFAYSPLLHKTLSHRVQSYIDKIKADYNTPEPIATIIQELRLFGLCIIEQKDKKISLNAHVQIQRIIVQDVVTMKFFLMMFRYASDISHIFLFDICRKDTFDLLTQAFIGFHNYNDGTYEKTKQVQILIMGVKVDRNEQREVSYEQALHFTKTYGLSYIEVQPQCEHNLLDSIILESLVAYETDLANKQRLNLMMQQIQQEQQNE
ncbi:rab-protein 14 isoform a [Stylonychia lemnae]|uniref:Rab-protein 14 isoform a n=1 Tax=Stylonychia lemnae TaxID=5949 RepID=A0A078B736_STYLE|nr:rab-protein 14 isoform a [Stylonychia lemnae]|eukprot:CDW90209.1 rab-protein 14 isoform a [Stylonychia lemnae]